MIRDFREKYNISETDLTNEISNRLSDIDISLDSNSKKYNLKTINELLVQQKLLTNLKNKIDNNEEVYVRKEQQGGADDDLTFAGSPRGSSSKFQRSNPGRKNQDDVTNLVSDENLIEVLKSAREAAGEIPPPDEDESEGDVPDNKKNILYILDLQSVLKY